MTRKDFEQLAAFIRLLPDEKRKIVAITLADIGPSLNPRFKRAIWLSACNVVE